jgi:carbon starvation protein CstA
MHCLRILLLRTIGSVFWLFVYFISYYFWSGDISIPYPFVIWFFVLSACAYFSLDRKMIFYREFLLFYEYIALVFDRFCVFASFFTRMDLLQPRDLSLLCLLIRRSPRNIGDLMVGTSFEVSLPAFKSFVEHGYSSMACLFVTVAVVQLSGFHCMVQVEQPRSR